MNKKGFDASQMFIYVVSIVVLGFVLLFGFQSVGTLLESEKDITLTKFTTDFEDVTKKVSADHGSVRFFTVNIPSGFSRICFIDVDSQSDSSLGFALPTSVQAGNCVQNLTSEICEDWRDYTGSDQDLYEKTNVYFISDKNTVQGTHYIEDIVLNDPFYTCATPQDPELRLEGERRKVKVSLS